MNTRFIINVGNDKVIADSELDFSTAVKMILQKYPISAFDDLYQPTVIRAFDITENEIEIEAIVI